MGSKNIEDTLHHEVLSYQYKLLLHQCFGYAHPGPMPDTTEDHWDRCADYTNDQIQARFDVISQINTRVFTPQQARWAGALFWRVGVIGLTARFIQPEIIQESKDIEVNDTSGIKVEQKNVISSALQLIHNTCSIFSCILDPGVYVRGFKGEGWQAGRKSELRFDSVEQLLRLNTLPDRGRFAAQSIKYPPLPRVPYFESITEFETYSKQPQQSPPAPFPEPLTSTGRVKGTVSSISPGQTHKVTELELADFCLTYGVSQGKNSQKSKTTKDVKRTAKRLGLEWRDEKESYVARIERDDKGKTKKIYHVNTTYFVQGPQHLLDLLGEELSQRHPLPVREETSAPLDNVYLFGLLEPAVASLTLNDDLWYERPGNECWRDALGIESDSSLTSWQRNPAGPPLTLEEIVETTRLYFESKVNDPLKSAFAHRTIEETNPR